MAVTKLTRLKESKKGSRAAHLINNIKYICNLEKTEGGLWIGGNAGQDPSTILTTMLQNKRFWNKEDGSQGFHYVIAFPPLCGINEQTASDFARRRYITTSITCTSTSHLIPFPGQTG